MLPINANIREHCGRNRYDRNKIFVNSIKKRIIGGTYSRVAEWPWLVSLQLKFKPNPDQYRSKVKRNSNIPILDFSNLEPDQISVVNELAHILTHLPVRLKELVLNNKISLDEIDHEIYPTNTSKLLKGHTCGGALISPQWVLTARHCFEKKWNPSLSYDPHDWIAKVGEHNLNEEEDYENEFKISKIIIYPYNLDHDSLDAVENDIALVKLDRLVQLNEYIQLACLPYPDEIFLPGQLCSVAGWGVTNENGNISITPQHIHIPLVAHKKCRKIYSMLSLLMTDIQIKPSMICAGGLDQKDACQFDSGGPLVCKSKNDQLWVITGIVSYGVRCASAYPGIYTRVSYFIDWIKKTIANE